MSFKNLPLTIAVSAALSLAASPGHSVEIGGIDLAGSGFATIAAGKMLNPSNEVAAGYRKPFVATDYAQAGVYEGRPGLQWLPDSKLGLQGTATFPNKRLSLTGQVVARGARDGEANLEWLYASYKLNDKVTIHAGRKRIPMFYYSDTQDIGLALPWIHLPSQPYGWEAVNYNGVSLAYQDKWGDWSSAINLLAGSESKKETGYWKIYRGKHNRTDIKWDDIIGGDITLSKDWFETRLVYLQSKMRQKNVSGDWDGAYTPGANTYGQDPAGLAPETSFTSPAGNQMIYGVTFNVDYNDFLVRSEVIYIDHKKSMGYKDHAYMFGVGYRFGDLTPMITVSDYRCQALTSQGLASDAQEATRTTSLVIRYDLSTSSDLKVQFDYQKDRSGPFYTLDQNGGLPGNRYGDSRLLTIAYDKIF